MDARRGVAAATDADLAAAVLAGNRNAFAPIVERYQSDIYNYAYRYTRDREEARDLTQETFLRAFRHLDRYRIELAFRNWLYAIAANICHDWARRRQSRPHPALPAGTESEGSTDPVPSHEPTPEQAALASETTRALEHAIANLPPDYRTPFILFHVQGVSQQDIAKILGAPVTVVKNRLYRARLMLRKAPGLARAQGPWVKEEAACAHAP